LIRKARGADTVFNHTVDVVLKGELPSGVESSVVIKMADIVGIITMKGIVVGARYKQKDAYDIHSLVLYYKSGPEAVAQEISPFISNGLTKEAINSIRTKFKSSNSEGPSWVADFVEATGEFREQVRTQSYFKIKLFLDTLSKLS